MSSRVITHGDDGRPAGDGGKREISLLAEAVRTQTVNSPIQTTPGYRGVILTVNVTDLGAGSPSLTLRLVGDMGNGGTPWLFQTAQPITTLYTKAYVIYPGALNFGDQCGGGPLPLRWHVMIEHANEDPITYSVDALLIP